MQTSERVIIRGIVRNGLVVPDYAERLIEGARVGILLPGPNAVDELTAEFAAWDQAGAAAWAMIDTWERETAE